MTPAPQKIDEQTAIVESIPGRRVSKARTIKALIALVAFGGFAIVLLVINDHDFLLIFRWAFALVVFLIGILIAVGVME